MLTDILPNIVAQSDDPIATYRSLLALPPFVRKYLTSVRQSLITHWETSDKIQFWYLNGRDHRENDQPAFIAPDGSCSWYMYGKKHRDGDQPAVIRAFGVKEWWVNGKQHRDNDQPAMIHTNGNREWWVHGM